MDLIIKDSNFSNVHYIILQAQDVEKLLTTEVKADFDKNGFEIIPPIAMRLIIMDKIINDEKIIDSINEWATAESVYKITQSGRLLKVRFVSTKMVQRALADGIIVLHQYNISRRSRSRKRCMSRSHHVTIVMRIRTRLRRALKRN